MSQLKVISKISIRSAVGYKTAGWYFCSVLKHKLAFKSCYPSSTKTYRQKNIKLFKNFHTTLNLMQMWQNKKLSRKNLKVLQLCKPLMLGTCSYDNYIRYKMGIRLNREHNWSEWVLSCHNIWQAKPGTPFDITVSTEYSLINAPTQINIHPQSLQGKICES